MGLENVFHEILERKTSFKDYKNSHSKKSKNWDFSKGDSEWFWSKIRNFPSFYFRRNRVKICFLVCFRKKKKAFLDNEKQEEKKSKGGHFSKGISP